MTEGSRVAALDGTSMISNLLDRWERESPSNERLVDFLIEIAEMLEKATDVYFKQDRDPFDSRHPSRAYPDCAIGHMLKRLFRHGAFMTALVNFIVDGNNEVIHTMSCRIMVDMLLVIDPRFFVDKEQLLSKLIIFAERSPNPLRSYATGILAVAMEEGDTAAKYKEQNSCLVPLMLERLNDLSREFFGGTWHETSPIRHFKHFNSKVNCASEAKMSQSMKRKRDSSNHVGVAGSSQSVKPSTHFSSHSSVRSLPPSYASEHSNNSWSDMEALMILSYQVYPLPKAAEQSYIIQYLTSLGEYQELLSSVFARPLTILQLILKYIYLQEHSGARLTFYALKYLAALMCHKRCVSEFISKIGIESILKVHRTSLAATGVSFVLFNLSCNDDAMQTVCLLDRRIVHELVSYTLSLIERSHQSGQCYATMFFENTFKYGIIRECFDELDGLRKVLNLASTLEIVVHNLSKDFNGILSPDQVYSSRQLCRRVCLALKHYFEAHAEAKAQELRRAHKICGESSYGNRSLEDNVQTLLELLPHNAAWKPIIQLLKLDGISFFLKLVVMHFDWIYSGKLDTVRCALDVLYICSVVNKVKLALCNDVHYMSVHHTDVRKVGMSIILKSTLPGRFNADAQRSALNIIVNCVCHPAAADLQAVFSPSVQKKKNIKNQEEILTKVFNCVRANDGIMILNSLMTSKNPVTDADSIRALACQALCGLSRCEKVMQIVSKLPLLTTGQLQVLMREPVLKDKRAEHAKFVKYCKILIGMVAGRALSGMESFLSDINKAEIVAETVVTYDERQLLWLMFEHLKEKGLHNSALALQCEANLKTKEDIMLEKSTAIRPFSHYASVTPYAVRYRKVKDAIQTFSYNEKHENSIDLEPSVPNHSGDISYPSTPIRPVSGISLTPGSSISGSMPKKHSFRGKFSIPSVKKSFSETGSAQRLSVERPLSAHHFFTEPVSLHSIVTEYLRNQHARCVLPYVTCPPFDLFKHHQCPEYDYSKLAPKNITLQTVRKQVSPFLWGHNGERLTRKFLSCRFREVNSCCDNDGLETISSCAFDAFSDLAYAGMYSGQILAFSKANYDSDDIHAVQCHETLISNIQTTKYAKLALTSASYRRPVSALWDCTTYDWVLKHTFNEDHYVEFSKLSCDRIVGTRYEKARLYDTTSGVKVATLAQPNLGNEYTNNRATFNYTDELILCDGVVWDVRQQQPIHKLDKLNRSRSGVFHPNGLEIISNTEIWDLRTYKLLKTVPELEQCDIVFDQPGHVFFGVVDSAGSNPDESSLKRYGTSLRTFDARDYTCISTKDVQRQIHGIALDYDDRYLAVIQNRMIENSSYREESICRIYEIGRSVESDDDEGRDDTEDDDDIDDGRNLQHSDDNDDDDDNQNDESYEEEEDENGDNDDSNDDELTQGSDSDTMDEASASDTSSEELFFTIRT